MSSNLFRKEMIFLAIAVILLVLLFLRYCPSA